MRLVQQLIRLLASLLLLLLIVICAWVGTYVRRNDNNGLACWTKIKVDLLAEFFFMSMSICSPQDNYYTSIPSIYVLLGDAVDCYILWWYHVGTDDFVNRWQCNDHSWWCCDNAVTMSLLVVCVGCCNELSKGNHTHVEKRSEKPMNETHVCGQTIVETGMYTTVRRLLKVQ